MRKTRKKLLVLKVRYFLLDNWNTDYSKDIIDTCASLLAGGKGTTSYDLYDLITIASIYSTDMKIENVQKYANLIFNYTEKHSEYQHIQNMKHILLNNDRLNATSCAALKEINYLISDFYSETNVACVELDGAIIHSSMHTKYKMSAYDMLMIIVILKGATVRSGSNRIFSESTSKKIQDIYTEQFGISFIPEMKTYIVENYKLIMRHLLQSGATINTLNYFATKTIVNNNILETLNWRRENPIDSDNEFMGFLLLILEHLPKELLMYRKFYIRNKGVAVKFTDTPDGINYIYMTEIHNEEANIHYIDIQAKIGGAIRGIYMPINNLSRVTPTLLYAKDYILVFYVLHVLGLIPAVTKILQDKVFDLPDHFDDNQKKDYTNSVVEMLSQFSNSKYVFEEPYWWNYNTNTTEQQPTTGKKQQIEKRINIGRYVRALPVGQKASEEAKALAKKYLMILEEGYTLVDDFEKSIYLKKY